MPCFDKLVISCCLEVQAYKNQAAHTAVLVLPFLLALSIISSPSLITLVAHPYLRIFHDTVLQIALQMVTKFRAFEEEALRSGARPSRQLVVAVTANGAEWSRTQQGFDCVCPKPVASSELSTIIAGYMDKLKEV